MSLLPIFVKLDGRRCLLVGAGNVALDKIGSLLRTGVRLRVVAPEARPEVRALAAEGKLEWVPRRFEISDLDGNFMVIAATDAPEVNSEVYRGAVERNIPCNSVDDIPNCDFFFGSVVRRGELQIVISTAGESPALAQRLRREIDEQLPEDLGEWLRNLGEIRREVLALHPRGEDRRLLLHRLAQRPACESPACPSRQMALAPLAEESAATGKVHLVGAGPGDPDLLTVKALRLIQTADVILHDDLVPQAILDLASPGAEVVNVGKRCGIKNITQDEINALMIEHARADRSVVRLKGGDPLIFGRAAEEISRPRRSRRTLRSRPRDHRRLCRGRGHRLLPHQPQQRLERDLLHRPSRRSRKTVNPAGDRRRHPRRLYAGPRLESARAGMAASRACRQSSPAPSSPTPRSPTRSPLHHARRARRCPARSPRPACSLPVGLCVNLWLQRTPAKWKPSRIPHNRPVLR